MYCCLYYKVNISIVIYLNYLLKYYVLIIVTCEVLCNLFVYLMWTSIGNFFGKVEYEDMLNMGGR